MRQYFALGDFALNDSADCVARLAMLCVSEPFAPSVRHSYGTAPMMLETDEDGVLVRVAIGPEGKVGAMTVGDLARLPPVEAWLRHAGGLESTYCDQALGRLRLPQFAPQTQREFAASATGTHRMGGPIPAGFAPALTGLPNDTQYVGTLAADGSFPQLSFDLHLSLPVFDEFNVIFVDYANPMAPVMHATETLRASYIQSVQGRIERATAAQWSALPFAVRDVQVWQASPAIGLTGVPSFAQGSKQLTSPKTGRGMGFLCQLASVRDARLDRDSVGAVADETYFKDHLTFFGNGQAFLFWEPETRLLGCVMENT